MCFETLIPLLQAPDSATQGQALAANSVYGAHAMLAAVIVILRYAGDLVITKP